jgi:Carboxypeptidase regulatory-like domain
MKQRRVYCALAMLLVFGASSAFSQGRANASISGIVQDQSKALIPGVSVTVTNVETGIKSTTVTNEAGAYGFPSVTPGKYSISASLPGFRTTTINNLEFGNVQVRQDITLEVATAATSVEVTVAADAVLRESSASIGDVLTQERTQQLPLVGANVLDLMQVMPGMKTGNFTVVGAFDTDTFTGQYANTVNVTRNGMSVNSGRNDPNIFGLQSTVNINPDLVGEIRLILSPVDPEYRGNAQIQVSTRSGTNRYTGAATWRVHNTALDSNTWANNHTPFTDPGTGQVRNSTALDWANRHEYTLSYGGPIVKSKTFFFASWDQQLSYTRTHLNSLVFTDTGRMGIYRYFEGWNPANPITVQTPITGNTATQVAPSVDIFGNLKSPPDGAPLRCFSVSGSDHTDGRGKLLPGR